MVYSTSGSSSRLCVSIFLGKYPIFRQLSNIFVSTSIAGSGRFFRAMYGMVSLLGLVLFLSDLSALFVSSLVMVLECSSDGSAEALRGVRCSFMDSAHRSTSALCSWLKYMSEWVL